MSSGLVGWWPLHRTSGSAVDVSGEGNDGTVNGATRGVAGRGGLQACSFDGSDDYIDTNAEVHQGDTELTIAAWVRLDDYVGFPSITGCAGNNGNSRVQVFIRETSGIIDAIFGDGSNSFTTTRDGNGVPKQEWAHVAVTFVSGGDVKRYLNGSQTGTVDSNSLDAIDLVRTQKIGAQDKDGNIKQYMDGGMSDVRFYNRVLSAAEVERLYNDGAVDTAKPPNDATDTEAVAYWTLDEDPSNTSTATDEWGGNDGTINGASQADATIRGTGLSFDGTDDRIDIPQLTSTPFTFTTWAKFNKPANGNRDALLIQTGSDYTGVRAEGANDIIFFIYDGGGSFPSVSVDNIQKDAWYHLAASYDGSEQRLYVNSELRAKQTTSRSGSVNARNSLAIGNNKNYPLNGQMDDVRIYSRALTSAEIHRVYRYGTFGRDLRGELVER